MGTAVLCLISSARVNRSDLIWDGAKSRVPEVQTEVRPSVVPVPVPVPVPSSPRDAAALSQSTTVG